MEEQKEEMSSETDEAVPQEPPTEPEKPLKPLNMKRGAVKLRSWLNRSLRIKMSDGRALIGVFLCTDRDANVILGSCYEYLPESESDVETAAKTAEEPRMLGLVMVPGKHIVSVAVDKNEHHREQTEREENVMATPLPQEVGDDEVT